MDRPRSTWADWCQVIIQAALLLGALRALSIYSSQLTQSTLDTHLEQRAWVGKTEVSGTPELGQKFVIQVTVKNTGKTFAKHFSGVVCYKEIRLADRDPDFDDIMARDKEKLVTKEGNLAPNGTFVFNLRIIERGKLIEPIDIDRLNNPTWVNLVFGKIEYRDIFGCAHWTKFCYRYYPNGRYETYGTYSDADNNCGPKTE